MRARVFGVAAAIVALIGCGDSARRLTADDITPIPPGTAVGSLYAGDYVTTAGEVEACHCRVGSCATVHVILGAIATMTQTDGVLQMTASGNSSPCVGGVDSDGAFRCDAEVVQADSTLFSIISGQFHAPNGQPTSVSMTEEVTATMPGFDCDFRGTALAQFIGPPSAFVAKTLSPAPASAGPPAGRLGIAFAH